MTFKYITYKDEDGIGRLTLNKPPLNVLDIAMMREIGTVLEGLLDDAAVKALVIDAAQFLASPGFRVWLDEVIGIHFSYFERKLKEYGW